MKQNATTADVYGLSSPYLYYGAAGQNSKLEIQLQVITATCPALRAGPFNGRLWQLISPNQDLEDADAGHNQVR